jgi:hypothetical protein
MTNVTHHLTASALVLAAVAFAAPSLAQSTDDAMSPGRANAIRECSTESAKLSQQTWGKNEIQVYRGCMAERGQME